jgi:hypothetical protein
MKRFTQILAATAFAFALQCGPLCAQNAPNAQEGQRPDFANMSGEDMQKFIQQRMMDNLREQLAITNNEEWSIIEKRLSKVTKARMESVMSAGMGMMGGMRGGGMGGMRGGGPGGAGGFRGMMGMGQTDPNVESLQKLVDANGAVPQIKAAVEKLRSARKQKQEELVKAQDDLRSVLTPRQEAVLILSGMLD